MSSSQEDKLLTNAVPEKTRVANEFWVRTLTSFCREKSIQLSLETCSAQELDDCLKKFYFGLRTKDGRVYQRSSYVSARSAIQRQLAIFKRPFDLRSGEQFQNSNRVLDAVLKKDKAEGQARPVQDKDAHIGGRQGTTRRLFRRRANINNLTINLVGTSSAAE